MFLILTTQKLGVISLFRFGLRLCAEWQKVLRPGCSPPWGAHLLLCVAVHPRLCLQAQVDLPGFVQEQYVARGFAWQWGILSAGSS